LSFVALAKDPLRLSRKVIKKRKRQPEFLRLPLILGE